MADDRQGGYGTKLRIDSGGLISIVYCQVIGDLAMQKKTFDMTGHDSQDGWGEKGDTGRRDLLPFDAKLTWSPSEASHAALQSAFLSRDPVGMEWEDPAGLETIAFNAHISQLTRSTPQDNGFTCTAHIEPTGVPSGVGSGS